jgi:hypothetical protein
MQYVIINEHFNINFHDTHVNNVYLQGEHMVWELAGLQTTNMNFQDKHDDDYYIKNAIMILENARIENIIIGGYQRYDENNMLIASKESVIAPPSEYENLLNNISYKNFSYIYEITELPCAGEKQHRMRVMTDYEIFISFSKSIIKWDEFAGAKWHAAKLWTSEHPN